MNRLASLRQTPYFKAWAQGYGAIQHTPETQERLIQLLPNFLEMCPEQNLPMMMALFSAADQIANAAMWLVVHQTYAMRVKLDGKPLECLDFKPNPQGHTGGALNMAVGYVGYMLANALSGSTRCWVMGQGHTVAAIDAVNLLMDNMRSEHASRYNLSQAGLNRYVQDFYSYRLNDTGHQDSPLGSHVNVNTAGGSIEGGYLGFTELQYMHMPLPDERLVAFLSDGAFEEQRGSDWAPRWWRGEDTGLIMPIMIFNGRRIDQRSIMAQGRGLSRFKQHLLTYDFDPIEFDGTDPAAFACTILEGERRLQECYKLVQSGVANYPVKLPYGIAVAAKGAGFYGEGTNAAHGLPLGSNPYTDPQAAERFNQSCQRLFVPITEIVKARHSLANHALSGRIKERDHPIANRQAHIEQYPQLPFVAVDPANASLHCPMKGIDNTLLAYIKANPGLRPRVGNPDEMRSNQMHASLDYLKHRVTECEPGMPEDIQGKVITALNEEAVICACLGNKAGLNLTVTYEAFAPKMLGALRQELIWTDHLHSRDRKAGWISVPLILTSNTYENGKNERSHQDPAMAEAMLGEPSDIARVLFPADYNSAVASLDSCYHSYGCIFTLIVPKTNIQDCFTQQQAQQLLAEGGIKVKAPLTPDIILTAIGSYQLQACLRAYQRLTDKGISAQVNYLLEPGRFRDARGRREAAWCVNNAIRQKLYPISPRVFISHTRPEVIAGVLRPLDTGRKTIFLGYTNHGGTLDTPGMLFVNRLSWAHIIRAVARVMGLALSELLALQEIAALEGRCNPQGILI